MVQTTHPQDGHDACCKQCGSQAPLNATHCPACGRLLTSPEVHPTAPLRRRPAALPFDCQGRDDFEHTSSAVLQFLPSGTCIAFALDQPLVLGRGAHSSLADMFDLSDFNALEHGVSRHHCMLMRHGRHLVVIDLNSTNGTNLNGRALLPNREYVVSHGDKLILGSLHLTVAFTLPLSGN
ncbi:MAG: FHA domain-containing protein [Chloroflexi bacterium]|nr:FHA domain-containing protein [Chloroflexota bacterium]